MKPTTHRAAVKQRTFVFKVKVLPYCFNQQVSKGATFTLKVNGLHFHSLPTSESLETNWCLPWTLQVTTGFSATPYTDSATAKQPLANWWGNIFHQPVVAKGLLTGPQACAWGLMENIWNNHLRWKQSSTSSWSMMINNDQESQQSQFFTWHLGQIFYQLLRTNYYYDIMNKFYLTLRKKNRTRHRFWIMKHNVSILKQHEWYSLCSSENMFMSHFQK